MPQQQSAQNQKTKSGSNTKRSRIIATAIGLMLILASVASAWFVRYQIEHNYAEDSAHQFEKALIQRGAAKQCSRGDTGRGWDNKSPWYKAVFEVPGNREEATELVRQAAEEDGYSLTETMGPGNPEDNKFYADKTSKRSSFSDLETGNLDFRVEIYGSSSHTDGKDPFCTVTKRDNPPLDRTTVDITLNLPAYKR
jgi:hypothetical protein